MTEKMRTPDNDTDVHDIGDCQLDCGQRVLRRGGNSVHVEPQVFDLLAYFAKHPGRLITKDELLDTVWNGRIVSETTLSSRLSAARKAIGDTDAKNRLIVTVPRHGFRYMSSGDRAPHSLEASTTSHMARETIRFCTTSDGVSLAVASVGDGTPVVKVSNWMNHITTDFQNPLWSKLFEVIAERHQFVRYDGRGIGLSDRNVTGITSEKFVLDLEAVVDSLGLEKFSLVGMSMGASVALAYAHKHPHRVERLILHGAFAIGRRRRNSASDLERANLFLSLMREGWGKPDAAFMKAFTYIYLPNATHEQAAWYCELQQQNASADVAVAIRAACDDIDVADLLGDVQMPTLVTHCRGDQVVPLEQGRTIAARLPNAQFVQFESDNHIILDDEPEATRFAHEVCGFLGQGNR